MDQILKFCISPGVWLDQVAWLKKHGWDTESESPLFQISRHRSWKCCLFLTPEKSYWRIVLSLLKHYRSSPKLYKAGNVANEGFRREEQKKFSKRNWLQWGFNPGPLLSYSDVLCAVLTRHVSVMRSWTESCFMYQFTFWTCFISRINRSWFYEGLNDSDWQPNVNLAQWERHQSRSQEVLGSILTGGSFCWFLLLFPA